MKKFITGTCAGIALASTIALAASYMAEDASFKVFVNGEEFTSSKAVVIDGRTYLPLRAIGDALGVPVNWNDESKQVEVGTTSNWTEETVNINNTVQSNDKWKLTYLKTETTNKIDEYVKAADGKQFVLVFFEAENISSETQNLSMLLSDQYVDDVKTPQTLMFGMVEDAMQVSAISVEPGKKVKCFYGFEISPDWKKIDIKYSEDILNENKDNTFNFVINK